MLHTLTGLLLASLILPVSNRWLRMGIIQWWCKRLLNCFNLQVTTSGQLPDIRTHGTLFVGNHISWSDIHAINSLIPVRFVAKVEIKDWPVFGYLVKKSGTIFINRTKNRDASRVIQLASHALKQLDNLCVFPEGTTTEGLSVLPFKSSLLQSAVNAHAQVIPMAISYPLPDGSPNLAAAYAGETSILESMRMYIGMQSPRIHIHFCPAINPSDHTRQAIAQMAYQAINSHLFPQPTTTAPTPVTQAQQA